MPLPANLVNNPTTPARYQRRRAAPRLHQRSSSLSSGAAPRANNPGAGRRWQGATPRHHQRSGGPSGRAAPWADSPAAVRRRQLLHPWPHQRSSGLSNRAAPRANSPAISECHQRVSVASKTRLKNHVMKRYRSSNFYQTLNHAKAPVWHPKVKKGLLGGLSNIRSMVS